MRAEGGLMEKMAGCEAVENWQWRTLGMLENSCGEMVAHREDEQLYLFIYLF